jgi:uncharacterized protein YndB with AHSA1/START domain
VVAAPRVELQAEVDGRRTDLFALVSTGDGLRRWLDDAELEPTVGSACRFVLGEAVAVGKVLAVSAPQHVSMTWDWEAEPLGSPSVVAFDLIDHGKRTHLTLRHVGLADRTQRELHDAMWRHWFGRLIEAARAPDRNGAGA